MGTRTPALCPDHRSTRLYVLRVFVWLRYEIWRQDAYYGAVPALWRVLRQMSDDRFLALSQFLRHPTWEAANNGAKRNRPWYTLAEISWPRCRPPRHRSARGLPSPQAGSPRSRRRP